MSFCGTREFLLTRVNFPGTRIASFSRTSDVTFVTSDSCVKAHLGRCRPVNMGVDAPSASAEAASVERMRTMNHSLGLQLSRIRLLVVDDQPLVRRGLRRCSRSSPTWRSSARPATASRRSSRRRRLRPDVVLMDLHMPRKVCVAATARDHRCAAADGVRVLTTLEAEQTVFDALRAGGWPTAEGRHRGRGGRDRARRYTAASRG